MRCNAQERDSYAFKTLGGLDGLAKALCTDLRGGLDPAASGLGSIDEHRRIFGANTYKEMPYKSFLGLCWEKMQDPVILILIVAALVGSAQRGRGWAHAGAIMGGERGQHAGPPRCHPGPSAPHPPPPTRWAHT